MGSVKLLKMQCHKELKRERERRSSSPAPAGRAEQQQVGAGCPTSPPSVGDSVWVWELPDLGMSPLGWERGWISALTSLTVPF